MSIRSERKHAIPIDNKVYHIGDDQKNRRRTWYEKHLLLLAKRKRQQTVATSQK